MAFTLVSATRETTASAARLWALYADINHWTAWDGEIDYARADGPFAVGTRGVLRPTGGPEVKFTLTRVETNKGFTDRSFLPLAWMDFHHTIEDTGSVRRVTHSVVMGGLLAPLFKRIFGEKLAHGVPTAVASLVKVAEQ
jgi:hypothetical protein